MVATDNPHITLGELITKARKESGLSQAELATAIRKGRNTIGRYELNLTVPRADVLNAIATVTGAAYLVRNISGLDIPNPRWSPAQAGEAAIQQLDLPFEEAAERVFHDVELLAQVA